MLCEKSPGFIPVMLMLVILSAIFCRLVSVIDIGLLELPTATVPKFSELGLIVTGLIPEPLTAMLCGLLLALSVMVTVPDCTPVTVGENVTVILHWAPAAIEVPQVLVWLNGALVVMWMPVRATF